MGYKNRSALFGIEPKGEDSVFSVFIEFLTSYVIRLAETHVVNVCDLVAHIIAPALEKEYLINGCYRGGNRFYDGAHSLNGFGTNPTDMVSCMSILTGQEFLERLTLIPL